MTRNGEITVTDHGEEMTLEEFNARKLAMIHRGIRRLVWLAVVVGIVGVILCGRG